LPEMAALIKAEEGKREQEIFYTVFNDAEFTLRKQKRDPFIVGIMGSPKVLIIGNELDLVS